MARRCRLGPSARGRSLLRWPRLGRMRVKRPDKSTGIPVPHQLSKPSQSDWPAVPAGPCVRKPLLSESCSALASYRLPGCLLRMQGHHPGRTQVGRNQLASAVTELLLQREEGSAVVELFADTAAAPVPLDALISQVYEIATM